MKNNLLLIGLLLIFISCEYEKDKLKIKNRTKSRLFCETLSIDKEDSCFYQNSGGAIISADSIGSPIVRGNPNSINNDLIKKSLDGYLYIVYYSHKDQSYVYKNIRTIVSDKRYKVDKYSLMQLDSLNWTITYDGN